MKKYRVITALCLLFVHTVSFGASRPGSRTTSFNDAVNVVINPPLSEGLLERSEESMKIDGSMQVSDLETNRSSSGCIKKVALALCLIGTGVATYFLSKM